MKSVVFLGDSLRRLRAFALEARQDAGYQIDRLQRGLQPIDFKPMSAIGKGVEELRVWDRTGTWRVIYIAPMVDAVYVLHAFHKKTEATAKRDLEIAQTRYRELMEDHS